MKIVLIAIIHPKMVYMRSPITSHVHFATLLIARQVSKISVCHVILTEKHITKQQNVNYVTLSHHKITYYWCE